jgi:hypothetical protein
MTKTPTESCLIRFGEQTWDISGCGLASIRRASSPVADLADAIDGAFCQPIGFTRLDQAIVSGDVVALAIDAATPSLLPVVAEICQWIVEHGTTPENLRIVMAADDGMVEQLGQGLSRKGLSAARLELHDPDNSQQISYVAADDEAQPIYINRTLVDADVVLPVSCARSNRAIDYLGAFGIFPWFSNRQLLGRLHNYYRLTDEEQRQSNQSQARQAAWWLGLLIGVQVIPTAHDRVAAVRCGLLEEVEMASQQLLVEGVSSGQPSNADNDLVIAVIDGQHQDWSHLARALHYAKQLCAQGGAIVLCTDIDQPIGQALRSLSKVEHHRQQIEKRLAKEWSHDSLAAGVLLDASRDHHVYLVSRHRPQVVEDLGMGVLSECTQLNSLIGQFPRGLILHSAQHP